MCCDDDSDRWLWRLLTFYTETRPELYTTAGEAAMSSTARPPPAFSPMNCRVTVPPSVNFRNSSLARIRASGCVEIKDRNGPCGCGSEELPAPQRATNKPTIAERISRRTYQVLPIKFTFCWYGV